jgi:hypothetical protein
MIEEKTNLLRSASIGIFLFGVFVGFFALGWWWLPAPNAWGVVAAILALVNSFIGLGYLMAQRPPE